MIHLELTSYHLQDSIGEWGLSHLVLHWDEVAFCADNTQNLIIIFRTELLLLLHITNELAQIVNLLLNDGISVHNIETVQVNNLLDCVLLIDFVENLPGNIIINLLKHFFVLLVGNKFRILFVSIVLIFALGLLLKLLTNL